MRTTVRAVVTLCGLLLVMSQPAAAQVPGSPCIAEPTDMTITFGDVINCDIAPGGDLDFFRFEGTAGQRVRVQLVSGAGTFPCLDLVSPSGAPVTTGCSGGLPRSFTGVLAESGTFTAFVAASGTTTMAYSLELECLSAELCGTNTEIVCDLQLSQATYANGETVTANVFRLANNRASAAPVELKLWLEIPGFGPISLANVGADGAVSLPAAFDQDFGPAPVFPVSAAFPRGSYALGCRILQPVTGRLLSTDYNAFVIQ